MPLESPNTLIFAAADGSPVVVSAANPLPCVIATPGTFSPSVWMAPQTLGFAGADGAEVPVSPNSPMPVTV